MATVPPGGPSTINGVLYQMLWALKRVGSLATSQSRIDANSGELVEVTLILEPPGGGDQQEESGKHRVVEQLKARADQRTWSLQELVTEVLPDLYRAVDLKHLPTTYRFVTEGRRGDWKQAEEFFQSLSNRNPGDDALAALDNDDTREIKFRRIARGQEPFWDAGPYTERQLFERIVAHLKSCDDIAKEPVEEIQQKAWHLLANFEFKPGYTRKSIQESIDNWLRNVVPALEDLPRFRDALLLDLARKATRGGARVVPADLLREHELDATPLSAWAELSRKGRARFLGTLRRRKIDLGEEARPGLVDITFGQWMSHGPIVVLTGESGQGKTWLGYSLLWEAVRRQETAMLIEACGDAARDQESAAREFSEIAGRDVTISLARVRERLCGMNRTRQIALLVDRVYDHTEARQLALTPWEDWGVRVAILCLPGVADTVRDAAGEERCTVVPVPDFTVAELQVYLASEIGDYWATIPQDVRDTLRRPLLASLYRDLAEGEAWRPTSEYELCERFWQRLLRSDHGSFPLDADKLSRAAYSLVQGIQYPWSANQLGRVDMDNDCVDRLMRAGWLRSLHPGRYEVWHTRLLNWAVAEGIVGEIRNRRLSEAAACEVIQKLHFSRYDSEGPYLGYVPMDVLWIALGPENGMERFGTRVLEKMECHP